MISDVLFVEYASGWPRPQRTIELQWQADSSDVPSHVSLADKLDVASMRKR